MVIAAVSLNQNLPCEAWGCARGPVLSHPEGVRVLRCTAKHPAHRMAGRTVKERSPSLSVASTVFLYIKQEDCV